MKERSIIIREGGEYVMVNPRFFPDLIADLTDNRGVTPERIKNVVGLKTKNVVSQWKKGVSMPSDEHIERLSTLTSYSAMDLKAYKRAIRCWEEGIDPLHMARLIYPDKVAAA